MADLNKIIDELSKLTVVEAADLSKKLEEKWGVSAATQVAAAPAAGAAAAPAEEKSEFTVFLAAAEPPAVGITLACGSGACAAVYAAWKKGLIENNAEVKLEKGSLHINIVNDEAIMIGPAEISYQGSLEI